MLKPGGARKRTWDTDDPEFLEAAAKSNKEAEKDAVRYVAVNEIFAAQHLSALQHWEDGTPNVRGQLTSLWVLGERPRREPVRYAPPPLRETEPEPPCCAPVCFQPGCGPWGAGGGGGKGGGRGGGGGGIRGGGFMAEETEPGSDFGKEGGGRNLDDFVDFNDSGSEDEYEKRGQADGVMDAMCAPFVGAAVVALTGASNLLKKVESGMKSGGGGGGGGLGGMCGVGGGGGVDADADADAGSATKAMAGERKDIEAKHEEIVATRDKYYAAQRTERCMDTAGCLGAVMRGVLTAMGRKKLGPPPPTGKLVEAAEAVEKQKEKEEEAAATATATATTAAAKVEVEAAEGAVVENGVPVEEKKGDGNDSDDDDGDDGEEGDWGRRGWQHKHVGYLKVRAAVMGAWHPHRPIEVSFQQPSVQVLSVLAAATSRFLWRWLKVYAPPPPGVTGVFQPSEYELLTMTEPEKTRGKKEAMLEAMTHRAMPHLPSIEREVLWACLACAYVTAAHERSRAPRQVGGGVRRKREVFVYAALLPGFRFAAATERTRRARRRRALRKCAFLSAQRKLKDMKNEKWEDVEFKRPEPPAKSVEQLRAELEKKWDAPPPPPGESLADRLARQAAAEEANEKKAEVVEEVKKGAKVEEEEEEEVKVEKVEKPPGGEGEGGDGLAGQLWGMLAGVDWAGMGAAAGDGAGAVGAALGDVEVEWSSQGNPENDSTSSAMYDASVARALKGCVKRHHRATRGQKAFWPGIEALKIEEGRAYKARGATERDDDDTDRPIGPQAPRMNTARA